MVTKNWEGNVRTADKHIYENPEIKEIRPSETIDPTMTAQEYGSSSSWGGSCCYKDRSSDEFSKHESRKMNPPS